MIYAHWIVMIASVLLCGCASVPRRQLEAQKRSYYRLRFDSVTTVAAVMHRTAEDNAPRLLAGVVELGGPVESLRGDTLIIEPHYMLMVKRSPSGDAHIGRFSSKLVLPDLVFI